MAVKDIGRYEESVRALEAEAVPEGGVVLYGSSTVALWPRERLTEDLRPFRVYGRGFGGSTAEEALYYYPRLVRPCAPRALVWYEGDNDPCYGYSPQRSFALSERVFRIARADFAGLRLILIGVKYSRNQPADNAARRAYNRLLRRYAAERGFARYIDLPALVNTPDGAQREGCFAEDGVHLTAAAYSLLAGAVRQGLEEMLGNETR